MKRLIAATLIAGSMATSALAGGFATTVEEPVVVAPNSSSNGWIPLVIFVALVAVAASASDSGSDAD